MEIVAGWATDFARQKFSVGVDENDLVRLLHEAGLGADVCALMTTVEVFKLLELEARRLAAVESLRVITDAGERARIATEGAADKQRHKVMLAELAAKYGVPGG